MYKIDNQDHLFYCHVLHQYIQWNQGEIKYEL